MSNCPLMRDILSLAVLLVALVASQIALGEPEPPWTGMQVMYHGKLTDVDRATRSFTIETPCWLALSVRIVDSQEVAGEAEDPRPPMQPILLP